MESQLTRVALGLSAMAMAFSVGTATPTWAASFNLSGDQLVEAIKLGESKYDQDKTAFRWNYIKNLGYGYPQILLRTEYLAVADYVRRSEFQRKFGSQKIHELTDERVESARREVDGHLQFLVTVYGPSEDFMDDYDFHLELKDELILPSSIDKPVVAGHSGFRGKLSYAATIIIDFPTDGLTGNEKVTLILDPPDGLGPSGSRDSSFKALFDLSTVK